MAISVIGTVSAAATSLTPTTHAVGDLIVIYAFRSAITAPTLPAGFINVITNTGNSNSFRVGYKFATSTTDASGTWTNASGLICTVYRGVTAIGASNGTTKAAATTATIAALTLINANSASWVVAFAQHAATSTQGTPLAGATTSRATQTAGTFNAGLFDTNAGVNSFSATTSSNTTSVVSSGGAFELIAADAASTLSDQFNQTSLNTTNWLQFTAGSATFTYGTTGAQVNYPASSTAATDGDLTSNKLYSLLGSNIGMQVLSIPATGTSADAVLWFRVDASNWVRWVVEGGTLFAQYQVAGSTTTPFSVAYNATTHAWWRISETGGNTLWQTSTDGNTWTTRATVANTTHTLRIGAMLAGIAGVCFQAESNPGTFKFANYNALAGTAFTAPQSDSVTTSESSVINTQLNKADSVTAAEAAAKNVQANKTDSASATDIIIVSHGFVLSPADSVTPTDATMRAAGKYIFDSATGSDSTAKAVKLSKADTVTTSDSPATISAYKRTMTDSTTPTDAAVKKPVLNKADSVTSSESTLIKIIKVVFLSDSVTSSDSTALKTGKGLADTAASSDAAIKNVKKAATDTVTSSDNLSRTSSYKRTAADAVTPTEASRRNVVKIIVDTVSTGDTPGEFHGIKLSLADSVTPTESARRNVKLSKADISTLADAIRRGVGRTVADSVTLSEASARRVIKVLTDSVQAQELIDSIVLRHPPIVPSIPDGLSAIDRTAYLGTEPALDGLGAAVDYYIQLEPADEAATLGANDINGILS